MGIPSITFEHDADIVSTIQSCIVDFSVDENFIEFEVRATKQGAAYGRGIGTLVMHMKIASPNYYPANKQYSYVITDSDLVFGEGTYRISMYACNLDGIWSDAVAFAWDTIGQGWDTGLWI